MHKMYTHYKRRIVKLHLQKSNPAFICTYILTYMSIHIKITSLLIPDTINAN